MKYCKTTTKHCQKCKTTEEPLHINSKNKHGNISYMCRTCNTERHKKYRQTKEGKEKTYKAIYKSISNMKYKQMARIKLNYHVRKGYIIRPDKCSICNLVTKVEGHHKDHLKPLEVMWVCRSCHCDLEKNVL